MNRKLTEQQEKEIVELYKTTSQKQISKLYNMTQAGIYLVLKRYNVSKLKGSRLNLSKLSLDIDFFKTIDEPKKAYWLGYLAADGNITKNNNKVNLISKDKEILEKFKQAIKSEHKISERNIFDKRTNKTYQSYTIQIGNELFTQHLITQGVTNQKTDIFNFPIINEELYPYFIAGLFDGDGSISIKGNNLKINLISTNEVLSFIQNHLKNTKNINQLTNQKVTINKINIWKMYLYKDALSFLNYIYFDENFNYLQRKYNLYKQFKCKK